MFALELSPAILAHGGSENLDGTATSTAMSVTWRVWNGVDHGTWSLFRNGD